MRAEAKKENRVLTSRQVEEALRDRLSTHADIARLGAGLTALLTGQDVEAALGAAHTALDYNFTIAMVPYLISGGLMLWTAYDVYDTYQKEGVEAALQKLVINGLMSVTALGAFKVAGKLYPTAELAWAAALKHVPGLKSVTQISQKVSEISSTKVFKLFKKVDPNINPQFWNKTTQFKGNKVYQRNDLIDPKRVDKNGITNLERMKNGKAPIGPDGKTLNAHHVLQTQKGPIAEMTETFHQKYAQIIHVNPNTVPSGINRSLFKSWRMDYWKNRAKDFE